MKAIDGIYTEHPFYRSRRIKNDLKKSLFYKDEQEENTETDAGNKHYIILEKKFYSTPIKQIEKSIYCGYWIKLELFKRRLSLFLSRLKKFQNRKSWQFCTGLFLKRVYVLRGQIKKAMSLLPPHTQINTISIKRKSQFSIL